MVMQYHSAHKFRHGHAVYALKQSKDIADLKAVSLNLMHSYLSITDGVYGILSTADVGKRILGLGNQLKTGQSFQEDLVDQIIKLGLQLKQTAKI
jgi:hypothetical protein